MVLTLFPVGQCATPFSSPGVAMQNPPLTYDTTAGSPIVQNLAPPFQNLAAHIDEINGNGPSYVWNPNNGTWNKL